MDDVVMLDREWSRDAAYGHAAGLIAALERTEATHSLRRTLVVSPTGVTHRAMVAQFESRHVFRLTIRTACGAHGDPASWLLVDNPEARLALFIAPRFCRGCFER